MDRNDAQAPQFNLLSQRVIKVEVGLPVKTIAQLVLLQVDFQRRKTQTLGLSHRRRSVISQAPTIYGNFHGPISNI